MLSLKEEFKRQSTKRLSKKHAKANTSEDDDEEDGDGDHDGEDNGGRNNVLTTIRCYFEDNESFDNSGEVVNSITSMNSMTSDQISQMIVEAETQTKYRNRVIAEEIRNPDLEGSIVTRQQIIPEEQKQLKEAKEGIEQDRRDAQKRKSVIPPDSASDIKMKLKQNMKERLRSKTIQSKGPEQAKKQSPNNSDLLYNQMIDGEQIKFDCYQNVVGLIYNGKRHCRIKLNI